jgi:hypothetical protein
MSWLAVLSRDTDVLAQIPLSLELLDYYSIPYSIVTRPHHPPPIFGSEVIRCENASGSGPISSELRWPRFSRLFPPRMGIWRFMAFLAKSFSRVSARSV